MGETLSYHCPRCGKTHLISYGWFFRSPATAEQVLNGEYGPRAKRNLERHPGTNVMFEYLIFRCSCGHARSKEVMTVFDDDRAPWDRDTRRKPVWDNARCSCPRCGKRMHITYNEPRSIICTCGARTEQAYCHCLFD